MSEEGVLHRPSIIFTGTGAALAEVTKFHSSVLFVSGSSSLLVDCGDGISFALVQGKISSLVIDAVLITHFHPDHFSGFSSLINQMKLAGRKHPIKVFCHIADMQFLREFLFRSYIFEERLGFVINWIGVREEELCFVSADLSFLCRKNAHLEKYRIYDKNNKLSFLSLSLFINISGARIFYSGDLSSASELSGLEEFQPHIVICEAAHIVPEDLFNALEGIPVKKIILTHYTSHSDGKLQGNSDLKKLVEFSRPGMRFQLDDFLS